MSQGLEIEDMPQISENAFKRLVELACLNGAGWSAREKIYSVYGDCLDPKGILMYQYDLDLVPLRDQYTVVVEGRCRKCERCLRHRMRTWIAKSSHELSVAPRTWFGTFTFRPDVHEWLERSAFLSRGYDELSPAKQIQRYNNTVLREFTLFGKKIRKGRKGDGLEPFHPVERRGFLPTRFRYLVVLEHHKSGLPHLHALLHEVAGYPQMRKWYLQELWKHNGFSGMKLVRDNPMKASVYVTKYLHKEAGARLRPSLLYGKFH